MWNTWGRDSMCLELLDDGGKVIHTIRPTWCATRNFPSAFTLAPGDLHVMDVAFDMYWDMSFLTPPIWGDRMLRLRAVYEILPEEEALEEGVWLGRVVSPLRQYKFTYWLGHLESGAHRGPDGFAAVDLLERLALCYGQKGRVVAWLRELSRDCHPCELPSISYLMCRMGDLSCLARVRDAYFRGRYDEGDQREPEGLDMGSVAGPAAVRQLLLYGTTSDHERLKAQIETGGGPFGPADTVLSLLLGSGESGQLHLPPGYEVERFPVGILISMLKDKRERWMPGEDDTRYCDRAAQALQKLLQRDFGHRLKATARERDRAIARIKRWWSKTDSPFRPKRVPRPKAHSPQPSGPGEVSSPAGTDSGRR